MKKYLTNLTTCSQVVSDNWVMEAEMLNQAQGYSSGMWWSVWSKDGMHVDGIKEGIKKITLEEALKETIEWTKPLHRHDCDHCNFLGLFQVERENYDLYFCQQDGNPTVIARFGEGGEYYSGLALVDKIRPLGAALERAIILGYIGVCPYAEEIEGITKWCACDDEGHRECLAAI